jgi:hypothetical protein
VVSLEGSGLSLPRIAFFLVGSQLLKYISHLSPISSNTHLKNANSNLQHELKTGEQRNETESSQTKKVISTLYVMLLYQQTWLFLLFFTLWPLGGIAP